MKVLDEGKKIKTNLFCMGTKKKMNFGVGTEENQFLVDYLPSTPIPLFSYS